MLKCILLLHIRVACGTFRHLGFSVKRYSFKSSHISNTKTKTCYTRLLQNLPLGRGSFHNAFVKKFFCTTFSYFNKYEKRRFGHWPVFNSILGV